MMKLSRTEKKKVVVYYMDTYNHQTQYHAIGNFSSDETSLFWIKHQARVLARKWGHFNGRISINISEYNTDYFKTLNLNISV